MLHRQMAVLCLLHPGLPVPTGVQGGLQNAGMQGAGTAGQGVSNCLTQLPTSCSPACCWLGNAEGLGGKKGLRLQISPAQICVWQQKRLCQDKSSSNLIKIMQIINPDWSSKICGLHLLPISSVKHVTLRRGAQ